MDNIEEEKDEGIESQEEGGAIRNHGMGMRGGKRNCMKGMQGMHHMHMMQHMGRGFIGLKYMILRFAKDGEISGSQIIESVNEMTMGHRRPSPGNVYPALKDLESEGYLKMREENHVKYYKITDKGQKVIENISMPMFGMAGKRQEPDTSAYLKKYSISSELDKINDELNYILENSNKVSDDAELKKKIAQLSKKLDLIKGDNA